jgi:Carboxypeptidase regulatory-like domain
MRPLHAALLLIALAVLFGGAYFVIRGDRSPAGVASAAPPSAVVPDAAPHPAVELAAPEDAPGAHPASTRDAAAPEVAAREAARAPRAAEARGTALAGRVVDPFGNGVADAVLYAAPPTPWSEDTPLDELDPERMPWLRRSEAHAGADGRFRIAVEDVARTRLAVRAAGFVPYDGEMAVDMGGERDVGDLALEESVVLEGRVVDASGRGVAQAEIRRASEGRLEWELSMQFGPLLATTDAQGRFRIDQLGAGPWRVRIRSDTHPDAIEHGETTRAGERVTGLEFALEDGLEIHGRLVGATPDELRDVAVAVTPDRDLGFTEPGAKPDTRRRAPVDDAGGFVVRGLRAGERYRLQGRQSGPDGLELFGRSVTEPAVAEAGARGVELLHRPETALVFQVVDDVTGLPLERFDVAAGTRFPMPLRDDAGRTVREHPEGRVRFTDLRLGTGREHAVVKVDATGYEPWEQKDVALTAGVDNDLGIVRLKRAPVVVVHVVDAARGTPVEGARVSLATLRDEPADGGATFTQDVSVDFDSDLDQGDLDPPLAFGPARRTRTDAQGVARLTSFAGQRAQVSVRAKGYAPYRSEPVELPATGDWRHEVRLGPGGTVIVRVQDSEGRPVQGARVQHEGPGGAQVAFAMSGSGPPTTDAEGEIVFENLEPGRHAFRPGASEDGAVAFNAGGAAVSVVQRVRGGAAAKRSDDWVEVELAAGAVETVTLTAKSRGGLSGHVTEAGVSLAGATVALVDADASGDALAGLPGLRGGDPEVRTNGSGEYRLDDLEVGDYTLRVTHPARAMAYDVPVEIVEGQGELDVDLPVSLVRGRVTGPDGKPLAGVRVQAERNEGGPRRVMRQVVFMTDGGDAHGGILDGSGSFEPVRTDADGLYELRGVQHDVDLVVKASGDGVQPGSSKPVRLAAGEIVEGIDIALEAGGTLPVAVERADGSPGGMCLVQATFVDGGGVEPKTGFTGQSGSTKLDGLKPGRWRLTCQPMAFAGGEAPEVPEQEVDVVAGDNETARFQLP